MARYRNKSTIEAELLALQHTAKETMGIKRLLEELSFNPESPWRIHCDNQQTIRLVAREGTRIATKLRHVDRQNMWLCQEHGKSSFEISYLPTSNMPADGLTKLL